MEKALIFAFNFTHLKYLTPWPCLGVLELLEELSMHQNSSQLCSFELVALDQEFLEDERLVTLSDFLQSWSGLNELYITIFNSKATTKVLKSWQSL